MSEVADDSPQSSRDVPAILFCTNPPTDCKVADDLVPEKPRRRIERRTTINHCFTQRDPLPDRDGQLRKLIHFSSELTP